MRALHQFVPFLNEGAVGRHLLEIQRVVRGLGWESEVFSAEEQPPFVGRGRHVDDYGTAVPSRPGDVLLYHLALGSRMARHLASRAEPLVVDYHNVTPHHFFAAWHPDLTADVARGRLDLHRLSGRAVFSLADSQFNAGELLAAGYGEARVLPILLDLDATDVATDPDVLDRLLRAKDGGGADWLFVGRVAPNKAQHHVVRAFAYYREHVDPRARLRLVGGPSPQTYFDAVAELASRLGIGDAVELVGPVSPAAMAAHYRCADVFVCLSDHEGFCVPLLEAWHHGVPVIAFASTAVPETLGDAGLLLHQKDSLTVAAAVDRVLTDRALREHLIAAGRERLGEFSIDRGRAKLADALAHIDAIVPS